MPAPTANTHNPTRTGLLLLGRMNAADTYGLALLDDDGMVVIGEQAETLSPVKGSKADDIPARYLIDSTVDDIHAVAAERALTYLDQDFDQATVDRLARVWANEPSGIVHTNDVYGATTT